MSRGGGREGGREGGKEGGRFDRVKHCKRLQAMTFVESIKANCNEVKPAIFNSIGYAVTLINNPFKGVAAGPFLLVFKFSHCPCPAV